MSQSHLLFFLLITILLVATRWPEKLALSIEKFMFNNSNCERRAQNKLNSCAKKKKAAAVVPPQSSV